VRHRRFIPPTAQIIGTGASEPTITINDKNDPEISDLPFAR
jgi:hypothetical protein